VAWVSISNRRPRWFSCSVFGAKGLDEFFKNARLKNGWHVAQVGIGSMRWEPQTHSYHWFPSPLPVTARTCICSRSMSVRIGLTFGSTGGTTRSILSITATHRDRGVKGRAARLASRALSIAAKGRRTPRPWHRVGLRCRVLHRPAARSARPQGRRRAAWRARSRAARARCGVCLFSQGNEALRH
jgi:hypothetical protein